VPAIRLERVEGRGFARSYFEAAGIVPFSTPWNLTGQPAAAVPAGFNDRGLPLSSQLVGRANDEATLLSLAAQIEAERPWAESKPPIS
jgi:amidase